MQLIKLMFTIGSIFVHCLYASSHSSSRTLTPDESATKRSQPTTNFQAVVADLNRRKDQSVQVHLAEVVTRTGGHHGNLTALQRELLRFQELFQGHQQIVGDPNWDPGIDIIVEAVNPPGQSNRSRYREKTKSCGERADCQ